MGQKNRKGESIIVREAGRPMDMGHGGDPRIAEPDSPETGGRKVKRASTVSPTGGIIDDAMDRIAMARPQPRKVGMRRGGNGHIEREPDVVMGGEHNRPAPRINMRRQDNGKQGE